MSLDEEMRSIEEEANELHNSANEKHHETFTLRGAGLPLRDPIEHLRQNLGESFNDAHYDEAEKRARKLTQSLKDVVEAMKKMPEKATGVADYNVLDAPLRAYFRQARHMHMLDMHHHPDDASRAIAEKDTADEIFESSSLSEKEKKEFRDSRLGEGFGSRRRKKGTATTRRRRRCKFTDGGVKYVTCKVTGMVAAAGSALG